MTESVTESVTESESESVFVHLFAAGARAVMPQIFGLPYALGPDELGRLENAPLDPRAYVAILSHLFGGCVMGADPASSVCDGLGRVHGFEAVHASDASAIPPPLGVNPQHTIMALARHWAEVMVDRPRSVRPRAGVTPMQARPTTPMSPTTESRSTADGPRREHVGNRARCAVPDRA